jgi:hypothetical protein
MSDVYVILRETSAQLPFLSFPPFDKLRINLAALERESIVDKGRGSPSH